MTTGASLDITQPDYLWVSVVCEMKGIFNLQGWIFMEPDQIGILLVLSVHAISLFSVRHKTDGTGDSHSAFCPSSFPFLFICWRCSLINISAFPIKMLPCVHFWCEENNLKTLVNQIFSFALTVSRCSLKMYGFLRGWIYMNLSSHLAGERWWIDLSLMGLLRVCIITKSVMSLLKRVTGWLSVCSPVMRHWEHAWSAVV